MDGFVSALEDRERAEYIRGLLPVESVEMEKRAIEFGA
jgi:hypothetical protein